MKLLKKWLFPVLTCLIVAGAAVLPARVSQARDAQQFGQIHTEELKADALPVYEAPTLLDRLSLYVRWRDSEWAIPSVRSPEEQSENQAEELIRASLEQLMAEDVFPLPAQTFWAEQYLPDLHISSWSYLLLWDPENGVVQREPYAIWELSAVMDTCTVQMTLDTESGLPLYLDIYDSDMIHWLSPKDPQALPTMAERLLALLGLEGEQVVLSALDSGIGQCIYCVKDTDLYYVFDYTENQLLVRPEPKKWMDDYKPAPSSFDG